MIGCGPLSALLAAAEIAVFDQCLLRKSAAGIFFVPGEKAAEPAAAYPKLDTHQRDWRCIY